MVSDSVDYRRQRGGHMSGFGRWAEQWHTRHTFASNWQQKSAKMTPVDDRSPVFQSPIPTALLATIVPMVPIDSVTAFLGHDEVITPAFDDDESSTHQFWTKFFHAK